MVCGFCGSEINPGFNTCPKCRAKLVKVGGAGCLTNIMGVLSVLLMFLGTIFLATGHLSGLVMWVVGPGILWMSRKIEIKRSTYHWVERP